MADSDSSLSSAPPTDDEMDVQVPEATATKPSPQKKKKKNAQPDAAVVAVKNDLSSFLQGLAPRK